MRKIYLIREDSSALGGAEIYLKRLSDKLTSYGFDHEVINSFCPRFLPSWLRVILFNIQVVVGKKGKFYFSLERIICPNVYRAGDGVHRVFLRVEKKSRLNPLHPLYLFLEKKCFNRAEKIIANSKMIREQIIDEYNIDPSKIKVVYNGIGHCKIDHKASWEKLSSQFHLQMNTKIILFVGSGFKRKGVDEFLQILSRLEYRDFKAFIVGKEKQMDSYRLRTCELGLKEKVFFTGPIRNVNDFYVVADVFILPTRYEPFSNVILEAMSFGSVVFTTKQNGAHEIISDEFIMSHSEDFSVVKKIDMLLNDVGLLNKHKELNVQIAEKYTVERNMNETLSVIKDVM